MFDLRSLGAVVCAALLTATACTTADDDDESGGSPDAASGGPDAAGSSPDAGSGEECPGDIVEMPTEPACAAATLTCIEACKTDECPDMCIAQDPDAAGCGTCLEDGFIACANQMGCQAAWDEVECCFDECDDPDAPACESECASQGQAYEACAGGVEEACETAVATVCFAQ